MKPPHLVQRWLVAIVLGSIVWCRLGAAESTPADRPLKLTAAERAWVAAHPVLRVGYDPAWPPFSERDERGRCEGVDADLLALLAHRIGVKVEFTTRDSWTGIYAAAQRRECDLLVGTASTPERARSFRFTEPYLSFPIVIVMRNDEPILWSVLDLAGRQIVGVRDYAPTMELRREYPQLEFTLAPTVEAAMEAVAKDRADAFVTNLPNASFIAKTRGLTNLKIAGVLPERFELRYAVRPDWPELVNLLDRAIASLSEADRQAILHPWIRVDYAKVIRWDLVWKTAAIALLVIALIFAAVLAHNRSLARELAERIRLQREIKEAHDELVRLNEEKTELLQMAAHDLRGPLTGMQLAIDSSLRLDAVPPREALAIMERQVRQMTGLLNDLLDVAALERGERAFRFERIDPLKSLKDAMAVVAPAAANKSIRIDLRPAAGLPAVLADAVALKQIFDNLLSNAVKFSPAGSAIAVDLGRHRDFVRADVRDQGPGVKPTETERIFAKYARGSARPTAGEKSTGLGLSIVRQLATGMNGRVWCESVPAGGGLFVLLVPIAPAA